MNFFILSKIFQLLYLYITYKNILQIMNIKTYAQFVESFTITMNQLPNIGDIVDRIDYNDGEKIAFVDFKGIKDIPIHITDIEKI